MRRFVGALCAIAVVFAACADREGAFDGFRDSEPGEILEYRITVSQVRTATGLGGPKSLKSKARLDVEEETTEDGYVLVVKDANATGEATQIRAARRLVGRRIEVHRDRGTIEGEVELFAGSEDLAAADIALLHVLFSPVLPAATSDAGESWRARTPPMRVPWASQPLAFTLDHEVVSSETRRELEVARVKSRALTNVRFRLPLVVEQSSGDAAGADGDLIVNELFDSLFGDIDNPIEGVAAAIAAIPLAIAAPFLAIGEALGSLFGGSDSTDDAPQIPAVDLAGPLDLRANSLVWRADGRVVRSIGTGTAKLVGTMPELPGRAAELTGRELGLDTTWKITRDLTSPWPEPRPIPGRNIVLLVSAVVAVLAGALAAWLRTRALRRRVTRSVRDTVSGPREPELADA
jgi:hypothetical protein